MVYQRPDNELVDGGAFIGFGYPIEGSESAEPVGRLFKGHFQRHFGYEPPDGTGSYFAGELSIPAPAGFSGGPLAYVCPATAARGVVAANHDVWVTLDRFEAVERDGIVHRDEIRRVGSDGIAARLSGTEVGRSGRALLRATSGSVTGLMRPASTRSLTS